MRKIKLYVAMSLNGYIADANGEVGWLESLPNPEGTDHGYAEFYNTIDTTIQGNNTYRQIVAWGIDFPYVGKQNFVLTRNKNLQDNEDVTFISENQIEYIKELKAQEGAAIWLIGGGQVNSMLLNSGLLDEIQVFVMPMVIEKGINLFENFPSTKSLELLDTVKYSTGAIELKYKVL